MRPVDPRLLRYARSARVFIALTVVLGVVTAVLVIGQARLLSGVIVDVTGEGADWADVRSAVIAVALVFVARATTSWLTEVGAVRSSARAKQELREAALVHVLRLGPGGPTQDPGATASLITRGVDALDGYFARYLPQLALALIVPIAVLLTVLGQDLLSTLIIAVTLPLIPLFMAIIGMYTRAQVNRQWRTLAFLSGHFLDLVSGLPTLKIFGRAKAQVEAIRVIGDDYRATTMGVLRVSFLSSLALELIASLSVALVAVSVGLRLAEGQISYRVALFVLLLAPEAYVPLRLVGQHFHAAAEGLGAAERLFVILETPLPGSGERRPPSGPLTIQVTDLQVAYPTRQEPALDRATFVARPGTITAVVGVTGGGKSTLLSALLGFVQPTGGRILVGGDGPDDHPVDLLDLDADLWRSRVGWLPQRAHLVSGRLDDGATIADTVRLGRPGATDAEVWAALTAAGVADEVRQLPQDAHTRLSADGYGLSVGQLQRIALARALLIDADLFLLDEPTAALDIATETAIVQTVRRLADRGATVIVVAHRPALIGIADQVLRLDRQTSLPSVTITAPVAASTIRTVGW